MPVRRRYAEGKVLGKARRTLPDLLACQKGLSAVEFALLAPALLMLIFAIVIYSLYFAACMGVRQATIEGARAAVTGMSTSERSALATARAQTVLAGYGALLGSNGPPTITVQPDGTGLLSISVSCDINGSAILSYAKFLPMPKSSIKYQMIVANGSY